MVLERVRSFLGASPINSSGVSFLSGSMTSVPPLPLVDPNNCTAPYRITASGLEASDASVIEGILGTVKFWVE